MTPLEQASLALITCESYEREFSKEFIDRAEHTVRNLYKDAGRPVAENSPLDVRIKKAVARLHGIRAEGALARFETIEEDLPPKTLNDSVADIYELYKLAKQPVIEGSPVYRRIWRALASAYSIKARESLRGLETTQKAYPGESIIAWATSIRTLSWHAKEQVVRGDLVDQRIHKAIRRAYGISARTWLIELETTRDKCTGKSISDKAETIRFAYQQATGRPVVANSPEDRRIYYAVIHACAVAGLPAGVARAVLELEKIRGAEGAKAKEEIGWLDASYKLTDNRPEPPKGVGLLGYLEARYGQKRPPGMLPG